MPAHSSASSSKSLSNLIVSNVTVGDCDNSPFLSYQLFELKINSVLITFSLTTSLVNLSPDPIEEAQIGVLIFVSCFWSSLKFLITVSKDFVLFSKIPFWLYQALGAKNIASLIVFPSLC